MDTFPYFPYDNSFLIESSLFIIMSIWSIQYGSISIFSNTILPTTHKRPILGELWIVLWSLFNYFSQNQFLSFFPLNALDIWKNFRMVKYYSICNRSNTRSVWDTMQNVLHQYLILHQSSAIMFYLLCSQNSNCEEECGNHNRNFKNTLCTFD